MNVCYSVIHAWFDVVHLLMVFILKVPMFCIHICIWYMAKVLQQACLAPLTLTRTGQSRMDNGLPIARHSLTPGQCLDRHD